MTFEPHVGIGAIIDIVGLLITAVAGYVTLKVTMKVVLEKLKDLRDDVDDDRKRSGEQHEQNVRSISGIEIKIATDCLKKDDFKDFERRLDDKIEKIQHASANAATRAVGLLIDSMKAGGMLRGGRE